MEVISCGCLDPRLWGCRGIIQYSSSCIFLAFDGILNVSNFIFFSEVNIKLYSLEAKTRTPERLSQVGNAP